jgi:hypothetical protein
MVFFGFVSLLIKAVAWISRVRVTLVRTWMLTIWGSLPLIILSPVGMSLTKVMETPIFVLPSMIVVAAVMVWAALRLLKAMSVVFDITPARTYAIAVLVGLLLVAAGVAYLETSYALRASLEQILSAPDVDG